MRVIYTQLRYLNAAVEVLCHTLMVLIVAVTVSGHNRALVGSPTALIRRLWTSP